MSQTENLPDEIAAKRQELADARAQRQNAEESRLVEKSDQAQRDEVARLESEISREKQIQELLSGAGQSDSKSNRESSNSKKKAQSSPTAPASVTNTNQEEN